MRVIKGLFLFCFLGIAISACFDEPEFSIVPEITFKKIVFRDASAANIVDTLSLYLDFKDGDGDLGLGENQRGEPYNATFYFLADGLGDTTKVATDVVFDTNGKEYTLLNSVGLTGKLVTNETRNDPAYAYLPVYDPTSCLDYSPDEVLVPATVVDASYTRIDTLYAANPNGPPVAYYLLAENPLLFEANPNYNNIEVKFWVLENGVYEEFDWLGRFCVHFDARFPVVGEKGKPVEGTLRYDMKSTGFLNNFSIKTLKLSVSIKDRALNRSNEVYTHTFKLDEIRR
jgi:hypothetical protein